MSEISIPQKRCTRCGESKPITAFGPNNRAKDKHHYWCRVCMNSAKTNYYQNHPEKKREVIKAYRQSGKARQTNKRYRDRHPERVRLQIKRSIQRNPATKKTSDYRREARKKNLPSRFTVSDWNRALEYFDYRCAICNRPIGLWHKLVGDHWIPLASADCPGTVPTNIVPLCHGDGGCNNSKRHKAPEEWLIDKYGKRKAYQILHRIHVYFEFISQS